MTKNIHFFIVSAAAYYTILKQRADKTGTTQAFSGEEPYKHTRVASCYYGSVYILDKCATPSFIKIAASSFSSGFAL
jgi:hypothetical protein